MHPDDLRYPVLFYEDKAYFLNKSDRRTGSFFGGPFQGDVQGIRTRKQSLHHIATITGQCFRPLMNVIGGGIVRLLYGIRYESCEMRYKNFANDIELLELQPRRPTSNWPYPDYPTYLPYFALELETARGCTFDEFCELSCQPIAAPDCEAIIIIPSSPVLGVSMWGPSGDAECVQIIYRYNLSTQVAEAYPQCG